MANQPSNSPTKQQQQHQEPKAQPSKHSTTTTAIKGFTFWAYFTISVSLLTLLLSLFPHHHDHRSWFFSLPDDLRLHHSKGKLIKAHHLINVFAVEHGPKDGDAVLFVHGLGCSSFSFRRLLPALGSAGLRAVAVDLPGSGFSDSLQLDDGNWLIGRPFRWVSNVYTEIMEKGIFWGFDQLVENGGIPYDEIRVSSSGANNGGGGAELRYGSAEIGRVLEEVVASLELAPVHLVLHDSALVPGMNLVAANRGLVRSVTLIDSAAGFPAFPSLILGVPVLGQIVLRSQFMFNGLLRLCCSRYMDVKTAEAHRLLVKGEEGRRAVVAAGKALNLSFDLGQWMQLEVARDMPIQVLWSNTWSDRWIDEGKKAASDLAMANFSHHSGGRWPQEDAAEEIADKILEFISSLPKLPWQTMEEPQPQQLENLSSNHEDHDHVHHIHHHHEFVHGYEYGATDMALV